MTTNTTRTTTTTSTANIDYNTPTKRYLNNDSTTKENIISSSSRYKSYYQSLSSPVVSRNASVNYDAEETHDKNISVENKNKNIFFDCLETNKSLRSTNSTTCGSSIDSPILTEVSSRDEITSFNHGANAKARDDENDNHSIDLVATEELEDFRGLFTVPDTVVWNDSITPHHHSNMCTKTDVVTASNVNVQKMDKYNKDQASRGQHYYQDLVDAIIPQQQQQQHHDDISEGSNNPLVCCACGIEADLVPEGMIPCDKNCQKASYCSIYCLEWDWESGNHRSNCFASEKIQDDNIPKTATSVQQQQSYSSASFESLDDNASIDVISQLEDDDWDIAEVYEKNVNNQNLKIDNIPRIFPEPIDKSDLHFL